EDICDIVHWISNYLKLPIYDGGYGVVSDDQVAGTIRSMNQRKPLNRWRVALQPHQEFSEDGLRLMMRLLYQRFPFDNLSQCEVVALIRYPQEFEFGRSPLQIMQNS